MAQRILIFLLSAICLVPQFIRLHASEQPAPVLMVIANQDFYHPDYILPRQALEAAGLQITVAAATLNTAVPHGGTPTVDPDITIFDADPADYSGILFVGGWGAAAYQYDFPGTYHNNNYNGDEATRARANELINAFNSADKPVGAICFAVTIISWARVDGASPVTGQDVVGYFGNSPGFNLNGESFAPHTSWHVSENGGNFLPMGAAGDPTTSADDVLINGNYIYGESFQCGTYFGEVYAAEIAARQPAEPELPVLMVLANENFYYREYSETRLGLEAEGREVVVAAGTAVDCFPHTNTGEGEDGGYTTPDITLDMVNADDYAAIVFVGGWGSSHYQYDFPGNYANAYYNDDTHRLTTNNLINQFVAQDKWVTAICFGVSVLAWSRVDGLSPLDGKQVCTYQLGGPACEIDGIWYGNFEISATWHVETNGAIRLPADSVGDPTTADDDVFVDTTGGIKVITAQNYDSALMFGHTLGQSLNAE